MIKKIKQHNLAETLTSVVTRQQLKGYGLSAYHAKVLTQSLERAGKLGNSYTYSLESVCQSIKTYLQKTKIKKTTRAALEHTLTALLARINNVISVPFNQSSGDSEFKEIYKELVAATTAKNKAIAKLDAIAASVRGKIQTMSDI